MGILGEGRGGDMHMYVLGMFGLYPPFGYRACQNESEFMYLVQPTEAKLKCRIEAGLSFSDPTGLRVQVWGLEFKVWCSPFLVFVIFNRNLNPICKNKIRTRTLLVPLIGDMWSLIPIVGT